MSNNNYANTYAQSLHRQLSAIKDKGRGNGAEKTLSKDKDTARRIARNEYGADQSASMYADLARYYRMGLNPPRELLEQIYERG